MQEPILDSLVLFLKFGRLLFCLCGSFDLYIPLILTYMQIFDLLNNIVYSSFNVDIFLSLGNDVGIAINGLNLVMKLSAFSETSFVQVA